jgi:hypothetical protein
MRNLITIGLLSLLPCSTAWADPPIGLRDAAGAARAQAVAAPSEPAPLLQSGWLWTGVALIGGGAAMLISGTPPSNACTDDGGHTSCVSWRPAGAALAASGGLTLAIGAYRRHVSAVTVTKRSVTVAMRF